MTFSSHCVSPLKNPNLNKILSSVVDSFSGGRSTYALVKKCDFEDVGMAEKVDAKCDAISAVDAKSDAEPASTTEQKPRKKSTVENSNSLPCI